jgi:hypothetical protein
VPQKSLVFHHFASTGLHPLVFVTMGIHPFFRPAWHMTDHDTRFEEALRSTLQKATVEL